VNIRHTDNIGYQDKNKLKECATRTPSKTGSAKGMLFPFNVDKKDPMHAKFIRK